MQKLQIVVSAEIHLQLKRKTKHAHHTPLTQIQLLNQPQGLPAAHPIPNTNQKHTNQGRNQQKNHHQ